MIPTLINDRWELLLPEHRAARPEWPHWECERLASMHENIRPGDVVYDVGAEEGDLSALAASWGAHLFLVEPNPRVWPNIRGIWEANDLPDPLRCFPGFAGAETSRHALEDLVRPWPACADGELIGDHGFLNLSERPDVPVVRIDTVTGAVPGPDILSIDVEGSEWAVLRGAETALDLYKPLIYLSVHEQFMAEMYGESAIEMMAWLKRLGYQWRPLDYSHELHLVCWHPEGRVPV